MAGNGPPPNPLAVRRNARAAVVRLPSSGRPGRTPKWPLPDNPRLTAKIEIVEGDIADLEKHELDEDLTRSEKTRLVRLRERLAVAQVELKAIRDGEARLWRMLWRTPQACEWDRYRWDREVAQYVRHKVAGELGSLEDSKEARIRAKGLGLTPDGLKALMWVIEVDELSARRDQRAAAAATGTDQGQGAAGTEAQPRARRRLSAIDITTSAHQSGPLGEQET